MAHPSRRDQAEGLVRRLDGLPSLSLDPSPDGPPGALNTLGAAVDGWRAMPDGPTHHLLLQDDVLPAPGFLDAARRAAERLPDALLAFYAHWTSMNGAMTRLAVRCGRAWAQLIPSEYVPAQALLMPRSMVEDFVAFAAAPGRAGFADDEALAAFVRERGVHALVAAPNLVEHLDLPSLTGNAYQGPRRSACFTGACPPRAGGDAVLRLADVAGISFFWVGEPFSVLPEKFGRWNLAHWRFLAGRLRVDEAALWRAFAGARATLGPAARALFAPFDGRPLSSLWISACLEGALATRLGTAPAADPRVARAATERMILGGLIQRIPEAALREHLPALAAFVETALATPL